MPNLNVVGVSNASFVNSAASVPAPLPASGFKTVIGQTVMAIAVVPNLDDSVYYSPVVVNKIASAAQLFGFGAMTRALGELQRQGAPSIIAIAVRNESDIPNLFNYVIDLSFDVILPVGLPATPDRIALFAAFAYQREQVSKPVTVVMQATPGASMEITLNSPPGIFAPVILTTDFPVVTGRYFVFTLDSVTVNPNVPSQYVADLAPSLAGLMVRNTPNVAITGQTLLGVTASNLYDASDALNLSNVGYTVLRQTTRHGLVPYLGVTGTATSNQLANFSSSYHKISTIRCAQYVTTSIQNATQFFIGEPSGSSVTSVVQRLMASLQSQKIIVSYDLNITIRQAVGSITISVAILPPFETTMINVTAQVNFKAS